MPPPAKPSPRQTRRGKGRRVAWVFVIPFVFFYGAFLMLPAIQVAYLSLTNSDIAGLGHFVGLSNSELNAFFGSRAHSSGP